MFKVKGSLGFDLAHGSVGSDAMERGGDGFFPEHVCASPGGFCGDAERRGDDEDVSVHDGPQIIDVVGVDDDDIGQI